MPTSTTGAIILVGPGGPTPQEQLVARAQQASALDLIDTLLAQRLEPVIVAAPTADWLLAGSGVIFDPDPPGQPFHFGKRLADLIRRYELPHLMVFGGGSAPFVDASLIATMAQLMDQAIHRPGGRIPSHMALTNNKHSSDWVAFTHADETLALLSDADRDNSLAWLLDQSGRYDVRVVTGLRPTAGFDLDTPSDLALAACHPDCPPRLAAVLQDSRLGALPVRDIARIAATPESNLTLIGRVAPLPWQALNKVTHCWVRVFAEDRGMVASGRLQRGEVKSLLGEMIRKEGAYAFFATLAGLSDAAIIDSRPIMASLGLWPSDGDRFASDLYMAEAIHDPWLREFTQAAAEAPIPILLGGHSLVSGGLYALVEIIERQAY
jgi:hypothetical protein